MTRSFEWPKEMGAQPVEVREYMALRGNDSPVLIEEAADAMYKAMFIELENVCYQEAAHLKRVKELLSLRDYLETKVHDGLVALCAINSDTAWGMVNEMRAASVKETT